MAKRITIAKARSWVSRMEKALSLSHAVYSEVDDCYSDKDSIERDNAVEFFANAMLDAEVALGRARAILREQQQAKSEPQP